jgi:hypothetical protein
VEVNMLVPIVHTVTVLAGLGLLYSLWRLMRRWEALTEARALIGEALLKGSRGGPLSEDR